MVGRVPTTRIPVLQPDAERTRDAARSRISSARPIREGNTSGGRSTTTMFHYRMFHYVSRLMRGARLVNGRGRRRRRAAADIQNHPRRRREEALDQLLHAGELERPGSVLPDCCLV